MSHVFLKQPVIQDFVLMRLRLAFHSANLSNEEREYGETFLNLCELIKDHWRDEHLRLSVDNFSLVIDRWIAAHIDGRSFESDVWRRAIANLVVTMIITQTGYIPDFVKVLIEKGYTIDFMIDEKKHGSFTKNIILSCKYCLSAIAKMLLEFEKQSKDLYDFAAQKVISTNLYTTAIQIFMLAIYAGGIVSSPFISKVFNTVGKKHTNINDDLKQLCDKELLVREGTRKKRYYVIARLSKAIQQSIR